MDREFIIRLPEPTAKQELFINSPAKRKMIRAGRRSGKTVGIGIKAVNSFLEKRRILYAAPTAEQIARFWFTVCKALEEPIDRGVLYKNESEHIIEMKGTENRIRAKTAWNADTLRGDYADDLIMDEYQMMSEDAWGLVGAPMMLDTNGIATFIYTPPSLRSRSLSKARDPQHAAKMFKKYKELEKTAPERYATFHFSSMDNPHLSREALDEITQDMTSLAFKMEIMAQDIEEVPGALWTREIIDRNRAIKAPAEFDRVVVAVDPSTTATGDEAGIIAAGVRGDEAFILYDESIQGSPLVWARAAVVLFHKVKADRMIAESNQGGEMVSSVIAQVDENVNVRLIHASRGKATRAEPISAKYEKNKVHHVGTFEQLEDELCLWVPGDPSPNRLDAMVWALTDLMFTGGRTTIRSMSDEVDDDVEKEKEKCWSCGEIEECSYYDEHPYCRSCYKEQLKWAEVEAMDESYG